MSANEVTGWRWPEEFPIIAGSGVGVAVAKSWGGVLSADTGMRVRVAAEDNVVHRLRYVANGLFHITAGGTAKTRQMLVAEPAFAWRDGGPFPVRVAWSQSRDNAGFIVRADSRIKTIYDIKPGTRMVRLSAAATSPIYDLLLAWAKVRKDEITWIAPKNADDKIPAVMDGRADLSFAIPTSAPVYQAEKTPPGIRWIELNAAEDPEGARRARAVDPLINFAPIINGVPSSLGVWGTCGISLYTTRAATDEDLVYHLAKWLDENWAKYRDLHSWNKYMTREVLVQELEHTFLPCHPGLVRYLEELGLWTEAHQRRQKENIALVDRYREAYRAAIDIADDKEIVVSPDSEKWLALWESRKKALGLPDFHTSDSL
ncbi:MAG: hypothetical protein C4555_06980 [Dehalococcoidia bacterium]|nr:MAG: hypothetical protein C4555_06980 [Dehalococcoidia bacterium]